MPKLKHKHNPTSSLEREPIQIELDPDLITNKMPLSFKPSPRELKQLYYIDPRAVKIPHLSHVPSQLPTVPS
jgi:hypothetical protein